MKTEKMVMLFVILVAGINIKGQVPNWEWAKSANGSQYDQASAVTADMNENIYVAGYFTSDSIRFGEVLLHNNGIGFTDIFIAKYDSTGNLIWAKGIGGSGDDKAFSIDTDDAGNVYLAANFYSPVIEVGAYEFINAGNVGDILLVKFDTKGNILWATREGGPGLEIPYAICVDAIGNSIVTGRFSSLSIDFGEFTLKQAGSMDVFIVKYNPEGNILWAKGAGGTSNDEGYAIDTDLEGNIYVGGYFNQNAKFESVSLSTSGQADAFLVKYDALGNLLWAKKAGGNNADRITGLTVDESGNCYVSGYFESDSVVFGATALKNFYSQGIDNSFIAKYNSEGNPVWAQAINGKSKLNGIAMNSQGIYACGVFSDNSLNFGSSVLDLRGHGDFFVLNCDLEGNPEWALYQSSGGESGEFATSIASSNHGKIIVAGYFDSKPITFGSTELNTTGNRFDMFVALFGSLSTDINQTLMETNLRVYPNPVREMLNILTNESINSIELYTQKGEKVLTRIFTPNEFQAQTDISNLPNGFYLLKLNSKNRHYSRKIIIQH